MRLPSRVRLVEVGPRDGLQNEAKPVPVDVKVALIDRLSAAGHVTVEAGSFVSPKWVPQMANTDEVMARIARKPGVSYPVLVPNKQGFNAALEAKVEEIAVFTAASESFCRKNTNCSIDESFERFAPVVEAAQKHGVRVRGYVSTVIACPYEGEIAPAAVAPIAERLLAMGCYEVSLGDTIGVGTPGRCVAMIDAVAARVPRQRIAAHFHDTYGQSLANILAVLERGITVYDTAVAGLGVPLRAGCRRQCRDGGRDLPAGRPGHRPRRRPRCGRRDRPLRLRCPGPHAGLQGGAGPESQVRGLAARRLTTSSSAPAGAARRPGERRPGAVRPAPDAGPSRPRPSQ
jgi:hydroxymethylglutaryl-CoA lyase